MRNSRTNIDEPRRARFGLFCCSRLILFVLLLIQQEVTTTVFSASAQYCEMSLLQDTCRVHEVFIACAALRTLRIKTVAVVGKTRD